MNCENVAISHNRQEPTQNKTKQPTQNKQIARLPWLSISKLFQHYINKLKNDTVLNVNMVKLH